VATDDGPLAPVAPVAPITGPLTLAVALGAVTGALDAISLARITGTFVGFQTGNTVLAGLGIGRGHYEGAARAGVAVLAFLAGSALTPALVRRHADRPLTAARRLLTVATALLAVDVLVVLLVWGWDGTTPDGGARYVCIVVSAAAMACQTSMVRSVRGVAVSSTFETGMLTRLGHALGSLRGAARRTSELPVVRVLACVTLAFFGGAIAGGLALSAFGNGAVVLPAAGLVAIGVGLARTSESALTIDAA
jgi:uncharacterized membrane protein YoaK (UPF0700 family)